MVCYAVERAVIIVPQICFVCAPTIFAGMIMRNCTSLFCYLHISHKRCCWGPCQSLALQRGV